MGGDLDTIVLETVRGDVAFQMALNEAILNSCLPQDKVIVRLIEFDAAGITLGRGQSVADVKQLSLPVTRRESAGSAMLCDRQQIYFAVFGPHTAPYSGLNEVHNIFGSRIANVLRGYNISAEPSAHYYVKVGDRAIAGSAQHWQLGKVWMYEGVLTFEKWDLNHLQDILHLRPSEAEWIASLPYVRKDDPHVLRVAMALDLVLGLSGGEHAVRVIPADVIAEAERLARVKYSSPSWLNAPSQELRQGLGFCLCGDLGKT